MELEMNTTMTSLNSISGLMPTLGVFIIIAVAVGFIAAIMSYDYFKKFFKFFGYAGKTFVYFIKGALMFGVGYGIYFLGNFVGDAVSSIPIEWYAYGVIGFIGLTLLGYVGSRGYGVLVSHYKRMSKKEVVIR